MTRKEELEKTIELARDELSAIEVKDNIMGNTKLLGNCFKYRNCHSLPKKESDYWWLYHKISSIGKHGHCMAMSFQTDKRGRIDIETDLYFSPNGGHIEISQEEFKDAWAELAMNIMDIEKDCVNKGR